jgi:hypothetical protein
MLVARQILDDRTIELTSLPLSTTEPRTETVPMTNAGTKRREK